MWLAFIPFMEDTFPPPSFFFFFFRTPHPDSRWDGSRIVGAEEREVEGSWMIDIKRAVFPEIYVLLFICF